MLQSMGSQETKKVRQSVAGRRDGKVADGTGKYRPFVGEVLQRGRKKSKFQGDVYGRVFLKGHLPRMLCH